MGCNIEIKKKTETFIRSLIFCTVPSKTAPRCIIRDRKQWGATFILDTDHFEKLFTMDCIGCTGTWGSLLGLKSVRKPSDSSGNNCYRPWSGHRDAVLYWCNKYCLQYIVINKNSEANHMICISTIRNICNKTKLQKISSSTASSQFTAKNSI